MKAIAFALMVPALLVGIQMSASEGGPDDALAAQARGVFEQYCYRCHGESSNPKGGFGYILEHDKLVERGKIVPGDQAESLVFQRIVAGEMPPAKQPRPSTKEIAVLKQWIESGAPAWSQVPAKRGFLKETDLEDRIRVDLEALSPKQRKFTRYFTAAHLLNAGRADSEIETCRLALVKLLNSLSWHPRLTVPHVVQTGLYRIDLRDEKWTPSNWERVLRDYPYKNESSSESARLIAKWTGTETAWLRADWFVATASRPPLYAELLQLPQTDRTLERLLQVDVMQDLQDENAVRAGFNDSGVSRNNRLLERHDAAYGAYWRSYDFADNKVRQSLFEHPLGPAHGETSFKPDGGEMIFHLPNGLLGFMIVNAAGKRADKAPTEIVGDPQRPDQRVTTGISCMSCHARGFLPKADQVRGHVLKNRQAFAKADVDLVLALYPPKERFQKLIDEDNLRFIAALNKLGLKLDTEEPVNQVTRRCEAPLDAAAAAAEVGLALDQLRQRLTAAKDLARVLGPLQVKGGTVQREVFEDNFPSAVALLNPHKSRPAVAKSSSLGSVYQPASKPVAETAKILSIGIQADGRIGAVGRDNHEIVLFQTKDGQILRILRGHKSPVGAVAFSSKGTWLASASADRTVRIWDVEETGETRILMGHTDTVRCVAFSPDSSKLLSGGDDRSLRLWDHQARKELLCLTGHTGAVQAVAWAPDGRWFVSAGQDGTLRQWEAKTGKILAVYHGHVGAVHAVAVSPDGNVILSGGSDKTVRLWDVATGKEKTRLMGHANSVIAVAFAANGATCLSVSSQYRQTDALIRRWDLKTGEEERRWGQGHEDSVSCAALGPDFALTGGAALKQWRFAD